MKLTHEQKRVMDQVDNSSKYGLEAYLETGPQKLFHAGTLRSLERKGLITLRYTDHGIYYAKKV
ncbi:MAG: hypothetical protein ACWGQW_01905 [bacterium]